MFGRDEHLPRLWYRYGSEPHADPRRFGSRFLPSRPGRHRAHAVRVQGATGPRLLLPRAVDTPGCTTQACGLRDVAGEVGDAAIIGISPDKPAAQKRFDTKYSLGFPLLSDPDHAVAEAFDVWREKKMYGRTSMGILRSAFLIDGKGKVQEAWYKISPKDTPTNLLAALGRLTP